MCPTTQKNPLPLLIVQKLKFNVKKYSVVTSQIRMSIHILEFPHNKDFYLYKSNKMQNTLQLLQKWSISKTSIMTCTHNFTKAFISHTDCITAVITVSCKYMKPTTYCNILLCHQHKSMWLITFCLKVSSKH